jgi:opine dehydrogenase
MSAKVGNLSYGDESNQFLRQAGLPGRNYSEHTAIIIDAEVQELGRALGVRSYTRREMQDLQYRGIKWEIIQPTGAVPDNAVTVPKRFITEDVPHGLVPLASLGRAIGVPTPVTDSLIELSCAFSQTDFRRDGRTLERLGLPTTGAADLVAAVS